MNKEQSADDPSVTDSCKNMLNSTISMSYPIQIARRTWQSLEAF